jgi:hypothetical protein
MSGTNMDRKQREQHTKEATKRVIDLAKWSDPEQRIYTYLFDTFGLDMLRAGDSVLEQNVREKLTEGGVEVTVAHYTGDSSYPTEYTIKHGDVQTTGPTFDHALVAFLLRLLPPIQRQKGKQRPGFDAEDLSERVHED